MSASPVLHLVLSTILGLASGGLTVLLGLQKTDSEERPNTKSNLVGDLSPSLWPLALLYQGPREMEMTVTCS
jgi:hypothetical protein